MVFEKFKREIKRMDINELNKEIHERKKELFKWNQPHEKVVEVHDDNKGGIRQFSKHPYDKIKKELNILNNLVHQKIMEGKENGI